MYDMYDDENQQAGITIVIPADGVLSTEQESRNPDVERVWVTFLIGMLKLPFFRAIVTRFKGSDEGSLREIEVYRDSEKIPELELLQRRLGENWIRFRGDGGVELFTPYHAESRAIVELAALATEQGLEVTEDPNRLQAILVHRMDTDDESGRPNPLWKPGGP